MEQIQPVALGIWIPFSASFRAMATVTLTRHIDAPPLAPELARETSGAPAPAPELTIILPTFNERANLPVIVERVGRSLAGVDWEILVVDDNSPDGTAAAARTLGAHDRRIRCIRRIGRR